MSPVAPLALRSAEAYVFIYRASAGGVRGVYLTIVQTATHWSDSGTTTIPPATKCAEADMCSYTRHPMGCSTAVPKKDKTGSSTFGHGD